MHSPKIPNIILLIILIVSFFTKLILYYPIPSGELSAESIRDKLSALLGLIIIDTILFITFSFSLAFEFHKQTKFSLNFALFNVIVLIVRSIFSLIFLLGIKSFLSCQYSDFWCIDSMHSSLATAYYYECIAICLVNVFGLLNFILVCRLHEISPILYICQLSRSKIFGFFEYF